MTNFNIFPNRNYALVMRNFSKFCDHMPFSSSQPETAIETWVHQIYPALDIFDVRVNLGHSYLKDWQDGIVIETRVIEREARFWHRELMLEWNRAAQTLALIEVIYQRGESQEKTISERTFSSFEIRLYWLRCIFYTRLELKTLLLLSLSGLFLFLILLLIKFFFPPLSSPPSPYPETVLKKFQVHQLKLNLLIFSLTSASYLLFSFCQRPLKKERWRIAAESLLIGALGAGFMNYIVSLVFS